MMNRNGFLVNSQTLTVDELAGMVRLAAITVRRDIRAGKLKAAHGGGKSAYRISRSDAETWWRARGGGVLQDEPAVSNSAPQTSRDMAVFLNLVQGVRSQLEANAKAHGAAFEGGDGAELVGAGRQSRSLFEGER